MKTGELINELIYLLENSDNSDIEFKASKIKTFEEAGLLTKNKGFVVTTDDAEFQITVVRMER